jgi:hypothetical protein
MAANALLKHEPPVVMGPRFRGDDE